MSDACYETTRSRLKIVRTNDMANNGVPDVYALTLGKSSSRRRECAPQILRLRDELSRPFVEGMNRVERNAREAFG